MTTRIRRTQRPSDSNIARTARRSPRRTPSPLPEPLLAHRRQVASWALQHGASLRLDAITAILGAKAQDAESAGRPFHEWTTGDVERLLARSAPQWCLAHHVARPRFLAESLCTYVDFLTDVGLLPPGADSPQALKGAAIAAASLTRDGRRRLSHGEAQSRSAHPASLTGR